MSLPLDVSLADMLYAAEDDQVAVPQQLTGPARAVWARVVDLAAADAAKKMTREEPGSSASDESRVRSITMYGEVVIP